MKLLLDTHIWMWSELEQGRLSRRVAKALENPANELWLSPISTWEILGLCRKGRIALKPDPATWIANALAQVRFREAPVTHEVALETERVVMPHRDPADRFLAATAKTYGLTLVTADENLLKGSGYLVLANR
jgi:PIN domain nuclease of toxin-antitoxin system